MKMTIYRVEGDVVLGVLEDGSEATISFPEYREALDALKQVLAETGSVEFTIGLMQ